MYKCNVCGVVSRPGQSLLRHVILRPNKQIERELPVCGSCNDALDDGVPLPVLKKQRGQPIRLNPPTMTPKVDVPKFKPAVSVNVPVLFGVPLKRRS